MLKRLFKKKISAPEDVQIPQYYVQSPTENKSFAHRARSASRVMQRPLESTRALFNSDPALQRQPRRQYVPELGTTRIITEGVPSIIVNRQTYNESDPLERMRRAYSAQNMTVPQELYLSDAEKEEQGRFRKEANKRGQKALYIPSRLRSDPVTSSELDFEGEQVMQFPSIPYEDDNDEEYEYISTPFQPLQLPNTGNFSEEIDLALEKTGGKKKKKTSKSQRKSKAKSTHRKRSKAKKSKRKH
jgi:hypothetical protein